MAAVIKPIYGAASIGVVKVEDMEGLKKTYKRVAKEMAGARIVDGAMQAGAADDDETDQVGQFKPCAVFLVPTRRPLLLKQMVAEKLEDCASDWTCCNRPAKCVFQLHHGKEQKTLDRIHDCRIAWRRAMLGHG